MSQREAAELKKGECVPLSMPEISAPAVLNWETPGSFLAKSIMDIKQVSGVYESIEPDRFTVFVILDSDPDDVLDRIFEVESQLYSQFQRMPFDVRVTTQNQPWEKAPQDENRVARYLRP